MCLFSVAKHQAVSVTWSTFFISFVSNRPLGFSARSMTPAPTRPWPTDEPFCDQVQPTTTTRAATTAATINQRQQHHHHHHYHYYHHHHQKTSAINNRGGRNSPGKYLIFPVPTPCSPVQVPSISSALCTMKELSRSASATCSGLCLSNMMRAWKFPSPCNRNQRLKEGVGVDLARQPFSVWSEEPLLSV